MNDELVGLGASLFSFLAAWSFHISWSNSSWICASKMFFKFSSSLRITPPPPCFANNVDTFLFLVVPTRPNWLHPPHICKMIPQDCFFQLRKGIFANFGRDIFLGEAKQVRRRGLWHAFKWECLEVLLHNYKDVGSLCQSIHRHLFFVAISRLAIPRVVPPEIVRQQTSVLIIKIGILQIRQIL